MADRDQDEHRVTPTGMVLHEPTFPNIAGDASYFDQATGSAAPGRGVTTPAAVGSTQHAGASEDSLTTKPQRADEPQSRPEASRPMQQRYATERPKPSVRHSLLGKMHNGGHPKRPSPAQRGTTVTFDPYSSESDSESSDGEKTYPKKSLSHQDDLTHQESRKRRDSHDGPFSRLRITNDHFRTSGKVSRADGRLKLNILEKDMDSGYVAKALGAVLHKHTKDDEQGGVESYDARGIRAGKISPEEDEMENNPSRRVKLNIVIIIIGSRGDIQPFIRIAKILKEDYGHRVRLATHPAFKDFVEKDSGLEFFSVGGNPAELMAFMVKNPGLIPNIDTIKGGEIGRRRAQMYEMFQGMWRACINASDDETDQHNAKMMGDRDPFVADAIIANPPSFAPQHIAEKLGIPLHMMFTFPYTPTAFFPHPLANIKTTNVEASYGNFMSYPLVEMMMWQGLGDLINRFRTQILHLEEVSTLWAPGQLYRMKVPYTYMWSPGLIPKPKDWGPEIDISGFVFLDLASSFTPPNDLKRFLDDGDPPVYIGFGSIVVDDPDEFTNLIFDAVKMAGCRALVSKGWGGFGSNADCPDNVFMIDNCPHDWLFPRCAAVVHHGGAGTTAIGLKCAIPTMIVPFFGDQPFWGAMVSKARAGAHECIPYKKLNSERLAEGIKQCLTEEARENVKKIAESIDKEGDGALNAVRSFHRSLPLRGENSMRCDFLDDRAATWRIKNTNMKLSALAAEILVEKKKLKWNELRLIRHYEWNDFGGPGEPITAVWGTLMTSVTDAATGVGGVPVEMGKSIRKREKIREKKRKVQRRHEHKKSTLARANATLSNEHIKGEATDGSKDKNKGKDVTGPTNGERPQASRESSAMSNISEPDEDLADELGHEAAFGFRKTGGALARFPMNLTVALTQGFHNAPRLYGDETVRRPPRVTGVHSGFRAGRDELLYGVMDGVTGIVTQPIRGARSHGAVGAMKGVGYGIGGFVLKDIAALLGPFAYGMKGLDAEYKKRYQPTAYLRRARITQGQLELASLERKSRVSRVHEVQKGEEKKAMKRDQVEQDISARWQALQDTMTEEKKHHKSGLAATLLGRGEKKEGTRVGRKSTDVPNEGRNSQSRSRTTPIAKADKIVKPSDSMANKDQEASQHNSTRKSVDHHGRSAAMLRSTTAPITTLEMDEHGDRDALDPLRTLRRHQAADTDSPKKSGTQTLRAAHLANETKNSSNPDLVDSPGATKAGDPERPSGDASSEDTRVGSESSDWNVPTRKIIGEEGVRPSGLNV
ncbi:glycosyltransferase family 1 protein [Plenodomus tracheiphilus IPT5]|uniref:Glycosyltransferase family 1 protein n=1 Tax=Plenodomus tracheiphilus IPT5 TaxID=1408161 RepID=A0A6A7B4M6_9PLEO|nr:glycosyltransferase family 1 protein [Plenodomus tracheiphilus IPT5]